MAVREPAVAGTFYPSEQTELEKYIYDRLDPSAVLRTAKAVLLPHAGYIYSGDTACRVLSEINVPDLVYLIGPNHQGIGEPFALYGRGSWKTPLGSVPVNASKARMLLESCDLIREDREAHLFEHSLEVEVPLLQAKNPNVEIVPMIVGTLDLPSAKQAAAAYARFLAAHTEPFLLVISSDMNHYESDQKTRVKDRYALEAIKALNGDALAKAVRTHRISMCGFVPAYMLLMMKDLLGLRAARLVDYETSAKTSGDYDRVVGYAGFIFE